MCYQSNVRVRQVRLWLSVSLSLNIHHLPDLKNKEYLSVLTKMKLIDSFYLLYLVVFHASPLFLVQAKGPPSRTMSSLNGKHLVYSGAIVSPLPVENLFEFSIYMFGIFLFFNNLNILMCVVYTDLVAIECKKKFEWTYRPSEWNWSLDDVLACQILSLYVIILQKFISLVL